MYRVLFYSILIGSLVLHTILGMDACTFNNIFGLNHEEVNIFMLKAYKCLTHEQQELFSAEKYTNNKEIGRTLLQALAKIVTHELVIAQKLILSSEEDIKHFENKYAHYLIQTKEALVSSEPIQVTDMKTARARAAQLLTLDQKKSLQRAAYMQNKQKTLETLACFADHVIRELTEKQLLPPTITVEELKEQLIEEKIKDLDTAYIQ